MDAELDVLKAKLIAIQGGDPKKSSGAIHKAYDKTFTEAKVVSSMKDAMSAVEAAPWDEDDSALQGSDIWGTQGEFAAPRASSNFTYKSAVKAVKDYFS